MHEAKLTSATVYLSRSSPVRNHHLAGICRGSPLIGSLFSHLSLAASYYLLSRLQVSSGIDNCIMRVSDGPNDMPWMPSHLDKRHDVSVVVSSPT